MILALAVLFLALGGSLCQCEWHGFHSLGSLSGACGDDVTWTLDPATGAVVGTTIEEQAEQACKNVGGILEAAGIDYSKVIKTTCFLADMKDFGAFNAVYEKYFVSKPARSCVAVRELPKQLLCEIEVIAVVE